MTIYQPYLDSISVNSRRCQFYSRKTYRTLEEAENSMRDFVSRCHHEATIMGEQLARINEKHVIALELVGADNEEASP